jgi:hypothetical protein
MFKEFKSAVILLGAAAVICAAGSPPSQVVYRETTGSRTERFTWKLETGDVIHLEVTRDNERYSNRFDSSGATTRWTYSAPQKHITALRSNNRIVLQGRIDDRNIRKKSVIDGAPWYQALSFCLRDFLASSRSEIDFWMIRPDSLKTVKMNAKKVKTEAVVVDGHCFEALKVKISLCGPLSIFWHAYYWYRVEDGLFLKYRGANGPPGTPITIVELDIAS